MLPHLKSIPVSVITGFLGAGKSTLLNRLLKDPALKDTAIIINEFGDVGIDHMLVEVSGDQMVELSNGCLCCTVRGELVDTLANFVDRMQTGQMAPLSRIVIETTGLADPAPVLQSIIGNVVIAQNFHVDGVITVVDAVNGMRTLEHLEEAVKQAAVADRLVISKQTLAEPEAIAALEARLREINPFAPFIDADGDEAAAGSLLAAGPFDAANKSPDVARWLGEEEAHGHHHHHHHHDVTRHNDRIRSFSIVHDEPLDQAVIGMFVDLLRSAHGDKLLRMKAVVKLSDDPSRPLVLHAVQTVMHPPKRLEKWPDGDQRTRMVLITQDLPEAFVRELFDTFIGKPQTDRPDRQALEDNPLAVPGMRF
ncbi:GTP-binding protein [Rhizobium sp. L1K21]|uniref:CobW family GTP-binding protein n=1 Tax=Rhizobium sp. L1K21 TaxID=2954933 RepID=UPI0020927F5A|nr:GTP-binding protein [Rhizobium sp. L1K21]MCO6188137.1 GTP-binding protein [Rhizobium sp. L1K21]